MNHRQLKIREFRVRLSLQKIAVSTSMQKHLLDSSTYSWDIAYFRVSWIKSQAHFLTMLTKKSLT